MSREQEATKLAAEIVRFSYDSGGPAEEEIEAVLTALAEEGMINKTEVEVQRLGIDNLEVIGQKQAVETLARALRYLPGALPQGAPEGTIVFKIGE